jgi:hypothetical protein
MQLINASVYEERSQARQIDIEESKKAKLVERQKKRDKHERMKLYSFLQLKGQGNQVFISGVSYRVTAQGNKLEKMGIGDNGPQRIKIGGVSFYRSKNGNYWRRGVITASRTKSFPKEIINNRTTIKKDKLCRYFTKTGSLFFKNR